FQEFNFLLQPEASTFMFRMFYKRTLPGSARVHYSTQTKTSKLLTFPACLYCPVH
ncbi:hypothetical protein L9F63_026076, partial [Diploptera punctata]